MLGRLAPILVLFPLVGFPALAQQRDASIPHAQDRPPGPALSPVEAIAKMTVPPGFSVELVASEPEVVNPVAMTIDERGRFWITESLEYPRKSAGAGRDRVKILEDTDGDGKADKFTVFADGLNIPSGIAVGGGGVWVANSPDLLFFKDTDGDGKADTKEVVLSGFGRDDTHELPNSLSWGPDGYLYGWNGVFNPARIDYRGKHYEFTCAVFRIDPKTRDFEVFCEGTSNPWGIAWNENGDAFASACVIDHLWHLTESGYYHRQGGPYPPFTWKLESIVDHKHEKAAYCGITYFDSDAYPEKYRGLLFMGNIHSGGINADRLERNGSTYRGKSEPDFLNANDAWFMPVVQKVGPDGSLYVLDWYDRYHCYQDANRDPNGIDRLKGRLYRVRYKDTPRAPKFDLSKESDDQLIIRLASPNVYYRETAQRLLRERDDKETSLKLLSLVLTQDATRASRLHALWTLVGEKRLSGEALGKILLDKDPTFRAWGVRASGNFREVDATVREAVARLVDDPSPDVRVQVAIASRKIRGMDPLPTLIRVLDQGSEDVLIPPIVWQNLHPLLEARGNEFVRMVDGIDLAKAPRLVRMIPRAIERLLGGRKVQPEGASALLSKLLESKSQGETGAAAKRSLEVIGERLRGGSMGKADRDSLVGLVSKSLDSTLKGDPTTPLYLDAALVATTWNDPAAIRAASQVLTSKGLPDAPRLRALGALVGAKDPSVIDAAASILADRVGNSVELRSGLLAALGVIDDPRVAAVVLKAYPAFEPELKPRGIEILTQRPIWTSALLDAIGRGEISASSLNVNQVRKLGSIKDKALGDRVKQVFGTVREARNPAREQVIERMKSNLKNAQGDPTAGSVVFKNVCGQCHKIYGEGMDVGPEVTLNGRGSYEQLLSNVFDPSLVIGPAFQATTIATVDGRILTGLVVEDSPERVVLKLQGGKTEVVARSNIEESKISPLSLMPEGLEGQITPKELVDLFAFLTLDKPPGDPAARLLPGTPSGIQK